MDSIILPPNNLDLADSTVCFVNTYPLERDLSIGFSAPPPPPPPNKAFPTSTSTKNFPDWPLHPNLPLKKQKSLFK